jgi:hypothetical protein
MVVADKPEGICSGRGCNKPSTGSFNEVHLVPEWRKPTEYSERSCAYELGTVVNYCAEHERSAKGYAKAARDYVLSTCC